MGVCIRNHIPRQHYVATCDITYPRKSNRVKFGVFTNSENGAFQPRVRLAVRGPPGDGRSPAADSGRRSAAADTADVAMCCVCLTHGDRPHRR